MQYTGVTSYKKAQETEKEFWRNIAQSDYLNKHEGALKRVLIDKKILVKHERVLDGIFGLVDWS